MEGVPDKQLGEQPYYENGIIPSAPPIQDDWNDNNNTMERKDNIVYPPSYHVANPVPPVSYLSNSYQSASNMQHSNATNTPEQALPINYSSQSNLLDPQMNQSYLASPGKHIKSISNSQFNSKDISQSQSHYSHYIQPNNNNNNNNNANQYNNINKNKRKRKRNKSLLKFYAMICVVSDQLLLPTTVFIILVFTNFFMINESCNHAHGSNCQCMYHHDDYYTQCQCDGMNGNFEVEAHGLQSLFVYILLFFIVDYMRLVFGVIRLLCKFICCGNDCCCCRPDSKCCSPSKRYWIFCLGRVISIVACYYFVSLNSSDMRCGCDGMRQEYCGMYNIDDYMEFLWKYCIFYIVLAANFIVSKLVINCCLKGHKKRSNALKNNKWISIALYQNNSRHLVWS